MHKQPITAPAFWAGVWRSLSWCLESVMLWAVAWHYGLCEIWRQVCQWFRFALRLCSWSRILAPGNSMQADLHTPRFPYVLIICSLPVLLFATLFSFSFCCIFICTNPKQILLMSARSSFYWGMNSFLVTPSMCCVQGGPQFRLSVSGAKNEPKTSSLHLLVLIMTIFPFLVCWWKSSKPQASTLTWQSRPSSAFEGGNYPAISCCHTTQCARFWVSSSTSKCLAKG